ncbi:MAG: nucleotidyl transferase AbiEii/AbiGii toxin family protein [Coriobacteriia bacterium]|nr:nucleotidyl transferase AbiEii/AbiGii toxin family protein [Coriobacteriia bacterium]
MNFSNANQLKGWLRNKTIQTGAPANTLLQNYMMERFLERVSVSRYRENFILKGGFLITALVGVDKRSTMDIDATIKSLPIDRIRIEKIVRELIALDVGDQVSFEITGINSIHEINGYDDFRIGLKATLFTVRVPLKIDLTVGDTVIPREIEYPYQLMFEDRTIPLMAYNVITILAEKIEGILTRNVSNTRARDFYDVYLLLTLNKDIVSKCELSEALRIKANERGSLGVIENADRYLKMITESPDLARIWKNYSKRYPYANGITFAEVCSALQQVLGNQK